MSYDIQVDTSPAAQILKLLQQRGALTIKDIEAALGVTTTAVRQQLSALQAEGLLSITKVREKRGRPHATYRLSDKGQKLFARGYENLAQVLLEEMLEVAEPERVHQLLQRVSTRLGAQYAEHCPGDELDERRIVEAIIRGPGLSKARRPPLGTALPEAPTSIPRS